MALNHLSTESIDPASIEFTDLDKAQGGHTQRLVPTRDRNGKLRMRTTNGRRDNMTMAMMKADMAALWRDGITYQGIADAVSDKYNLEGTERILKNNVHYHIKSMLTYWREKGMARMDERQAMLLARLDQLESICVEAYFKSCEGKTTHNYTKQLKRARSRDRAEDLLDKEVEDREENFNGNDKLLKNQKYFADTGELADLLIVTEEKIDESERHEENGPGDPKWVAIMFNINKERAKILGLHNHQNTNDPDQESAKLTDDERQQRVMAILSAAKERREASASMLAPASPMGGFKKEDVPEIIQEDVPEIENEEVNDWGFTDEEDDFQWD